MSFLLDSLKLLACAASIYACFIGYGVLQERIYRRDYTYVGADGQVRHERFDHSLFLVCCQCAGNALFAAAIYAIKAAAGYKIRAPSTPMRSYLVISMTYIGAMFTSNLALNYMSYPAQSLAKSCKVIPVMLMRILINGKRYAWSEWAQMLIITGGIALFMMSEDGGKRGGADTSLIGLVLCLVSLALDGFTGPLQENINAEFSPPMEEMMFFLNAFAVAVVAAVLVINGDGWSGSSFFIRHVDIIPETAMFSLLSALGQAAILITIMLFDSLVLVTVTTTRKFFTILASVVMYGHALTVGQWSGVAIVFLGLSMEAADKYRHRHKPRAAAVGQHKSD